MPTGVYSRTEKYRRERSEKLRGKHISPKTEFKKGQIPWNKGKKGLQIAWNKGRKWSQKVKDKVRKNRKGKCLGSKNPAFNNWSSIKPYGIEFNEQLKESIRKRDNQTCQECFFTQKQLKKKLAIHHIDFDKNNNNPENLITLCNSCHSQTNFNRENWIGYFQEKINNPGGIK